MKLQNEGRDLQRKVSGLSEESKVKSSSMCYLPSEETVPIHLLIILNGRLNGTELRTLNDDGCNKNIF